MPVCVPCALIGLSPSTMALGKFWGPLVPVSPSLRTSHLSHVQWVCLCVPVMGKTQGREPFDRVSF